MNLSEQIEGLKQRQRALLVKAEAAKGEEDRVAGEATALGVHVAQGQDLLEALQTAGQHASQSTQAAESTLQQAVTTLDQALTAVEQRVNGQ